MIRENYPHLVILTLNMLDLKALSVLKRTHAMDPHVPVIP
jgi:DNA-binding NtrC family response regulator